MNLSELSSGAKCRILSIKGEGAFRKRILEMGFVKGQVVEVVRNAPLKDPVYYRIMGYNVSLRRKDAELITVDLLEGTLLCEDDTLAGADFSHLPYASHQDLREEPEVAGADHVAEPLLDKKNRKKIKVAMVGNPNCGKTSIFNIASGAHERVGNYSGVTVEAHEAHFTRGNYRIDIVDLPGSYSLSPYSPEELYIRDYLTDAKTRPDLVINVIDTTNLERNLYLTIQLIEMEIPVVVALNMYDEFVKHKSKLDRKKLELLLGLPMVPTIGRVPGGINKLLATVVATYEKLQAEPSERREITVPYGSVLEPAVQLLTEKIAQGDSCPPHFPPRYIAVKLLEEDRKVMEEVKQWPKGDYYLSAANFERKKCEALLGEVSAQTVITDQRYGFIAGALRETYRSERKEAKTTSARIDDILLHRFWGLPLFLFFIILMFQATFTLGAFPQAWIESAVAWIGSQAAASLPEGPLVDLLVDGVIGGVGGVIVFLPQIVILFLFISLMEDTGYMARATFLMDKLMHGMGLHGKSFIPLIMGFGCNVPAIMATRTIESRQSRLITVLVTPLMSCSARLPVYILLAGAFFPRYAGIVLFSLYILGIFLAILFAWLFRRLFFKKEDLPFVMELPPYRVPTYKSVLIHMWEKSRQYLVKMGTVILFASILIWVLGYFPRRQVMQQAATQIAAIEASSLSDNEKKEQINRAEETARQAQQKTSILGRIGCAIEPLIKPLGFNWKMGIALVSGLPAKEVVVSTLGVIYTGHADDDDKATQQLGERLRQDKDSEGHPSFTPLIAYTFMAFVLIYFPCIAVIAAVRREAGGWKWGLLVITYTCTLAWCVAFIIYQLGTLLGWGQ